MDFTPKFRKTYDTKREEQCEIPCNIGTVWKMAATCTTMFFLIPKNLVGMVAGARIDEMAAKASCCWDATAGRNGGAERIVWETWLEMERFDNRAGEQDQGAITLVLDISLKAIERVGVPVVWAWATHFKFAPKEVQCLYFDRQRRMQFEGCVAEPFQTMTPSSLGSDGVALSHCVSAFEVEDFRGHHRFHGRAKQGDRNCR